MSVPPAQPRGSFKAIFVLALLVTSCGALSQSLNALRTVQQAVVRLANTPDVTVNLNNGRALTIGIVNSPLKDLGPDEKLEKALEIATLGYGTYPLRSTLERVNVVFPTSRRYLLFASVNRVGDGDSLSFPSSRLVARTSSGTARTPLPPSEAVLYLVAIGEGQQELVERVASQLRRRFGMPITVLPPIAVDQVTYDRGRSQVVADELISVVRQRYATVVRERNSRVIGITPYDMYTKQIQRWAFTFSLRDAEDQVAVVSDARMNPVIFGNVPDDELLQSRLRKMVIKNVGIMCYGFPLSPDPKSVMYGSIGGTDELDVMTEDFDP
jgi:predicted Zn-dependent protease